MNGLAGLEPWLEKCFFPAAGPFVCGVSGGADSVALLALAAATGLDVEAVHVDHGQRPESEADFVAGLAKKWGARFRAERVEVASGANLEARMRAARYQVLGSDAATGHTADDQAETLLINLMRGAAIPGLGAMRPGHRRPILHLRRTDTEAICQMLGVEPFSDPTNADPRFLRNRVRHELIPLLGELSARDVVPLLNRTSNHARDVSAFIERVARTIDATDAKQLTKADPYVAGAAIQMWLRDVTASDHPVDAASVARVLEVAAGAYEATEVSGGHRVSRSRQRLKVDEATSP